ncbi:DUF6766 family protein [Xanthocytophaga agilis]|uniref:Transmembrane protein n=1 Tax=Xanthocytophaga agilis TaxID=3048010 RepID=A0AAE3R3G6_9BACT|nr:DUF6766 family protein [Xanthocytophaga agilis]MDJ1499987.1 hypothetical protein [Xanthocytophaga agilis]
MAFNNHSFWYRNGLSLVLVTLFLLFWLGQVFTGWHSNNQALNEAGATPLSLADYLSSGHFISATFENWESEFLQMAAYVLLTVSLRQKGSSESKKLDEEEDVDRQPTPSSEAPWPVRKGGIWLKLYKNSLSLAFFLLFLCSFTLHLHGSYLNYKDEQAQKGLPAEPLHSYCFDSQFWFESLQNWQSEFLAVLSIVVLSIYLRQYGSPESKPVDAPHSQTGKE